MTSTGQNQVSRVAPSIIEKGDVARCSLPDGKKVAIKEPAAARIARQYPQLIQKQIKPAEDRFISRRCRHSVEAANYLLTKKITTSPNKYLLDVFTQLDSMVVTWRKKFMHQLMVRENAIPGVRQKQVLRAGEPPTENKLPGNLAGHPKDSWSEECFEDGMWKSRPRKRPLIGLMDAVLDLPGFRGTGTQFRTNSVMDWSSKDVVVASLQNRVTFYNNHHGQADELLQLENINACMLKWSNDGNLLAIGYQPHFLSIFDVPTQKFLWSVRCRCYVTHNLICVTRCVCWSQNDQHVLGACKRVINVYLAKCGSWVNTIPLNAGILTMAFSPNYRYIISTFNDSNVRIFSWPSLAPFLEISYYAPVEAVAWHPQESGLVCIGGGEGDASLSLWNVNKMQPLGFRKVAFFGCVENLAWCKNTGELVVHWTYLVNRERYTIVPILGSLDRIVDALPVERDTRVGHIMWNSDHSQIAVQTDESLLIWNFNGNEYDYKHKSKGLQKKAIGLGALAYESRRSFMHCNLR